MIKNETTKQRVDRKIDHKLHVINVARGLEKADLVIKNATFFNVFTCELDYGDIAIVDGLIAGISEDYKGKKTYDASNKIVLPGFIDSHIHLESALVSPIEFAKAVVRHGTTTVICDPHEIANVMGKDGIKYMLEATENLPIDVHFMLPSCVPCSDMDESGATLSYHSIEEFYDHPRVLGLAEMMNYVGVINADKMPVEKIIAAQSHHKKIDGHAPGLHGKALCAYIAAGVYSDHECDNYSEALEKLKLGQFIMIRHGTAAKNLHNLHPLINAKYASRCMFCTDDKHPLDLLNKGHIDYIVKKSQEKGVDPLLALKVATHNAARYFLLNNKGAIAPGYLADIAVVDNIRDLNVLQVFKKGKTVFDGKDVFVNEVKISESLTKKAENTFNVDHVDASRFKATRLPTIEVIPNSILTKKAGFNECIDVDNDILKIAVIERHKNTGHIGLGYVKGYGLKKGAIATSVAHDSHNIIVVGCSDEEMALAVNTIIDNQGGIVVINNNKVIAQVPLKIAGLMSDKTLIEVNNELEDAKKKAKQMGILENIDPFMTLSFVSLPVIPEVKITTKGVFDVTTWSYLK